LQRRRAPSTTVIGDGERVGEFASWLLVVPRLKLRRVGVHMCVAYDETDKQMA